MNVVLTYWIIPGEKIAHVLPNKEERRQEAARTLQVYSTPLHFFRVEFLENIGKAPVMNLPVLY